MDARRYVELMSVPFSPSPGKGDNERDLVWQVAAGNRVGRLTHRLRSCDDLEAPVSQVGFDSGVNNSSVSHGNSYNSTAPNPSPVAQPIASPPLVAGRHCGTRTAHRWTDCASGEQGWCPCRVPEQSRRT